MLLFFEHVASSGASNEEPIDEAIRNWDSADVSEPALQRLLENVFSATEIAEQERMKAQQALKEAQQAYDKSQRSLERAQARPRTRLRTRASQKALELQTAAKGEFSAAEQALKRAKKALEKAQQEQDQAFDLALQTYADALLDRGDSRGELISIYRTLRFKELPDGEILKK